MKKIYLFLLTAFVAFGMTSCGDDDPDGAEIFPTSAVNRDSFDKWLLKNFTMPYNVEVKYKMEDIYSDMSYDLVPADSANSAKLMKIAKYLWFDAYAEVMGPEFVKENVPRVIHLIGSPAYNVGQGTMVLGTAEGGYIVTLYMVNSLDDDMLADYSLMNEYYFHTMHHEFTHIMTQKKSYSENYQLITANSYVNGDWYQKSDHEAHQAGYVTPYSMSESNEDFAEVMSTYITDSPEQWQAILDDAGTEGAAYINQKLAIVRTYMKESWGLDIDKMRDCIQRRGKQLGSLDLEKLD
jgi:substrate import-associated zinc metallohydrolase lipoprotein